MEQNNLLIAQGLNNLFVWFASLKPNAYTKKPSVNIKQADAIEILKQLNQICAITGYQNHVVENGDGTVSVVLEEIKLPETTDEALEEIVDLTKDIGQEL